MLNISKSGKSIYVLYGAKNFATGQTVAGTVYDGSNSSSSLTMTEIGSTGLYGGTFTPSTTGEYKVLITESGVSKAHAEIKIGNYDIETVGAAVDAIDTVVDGIASDVANLDSDLVTVSGNVTSIKTIVEHATYGNSALNDKLDDMSGAGFQTSEDSLEAIKNYLVNTIQASIAGIQNNTRTTVALPTQMILPDTGTTSFKFYVNVYDAGGDMEDPNDQDPGSGTAMVSVAVANSAGTNRSGNLSGLDTSTLDGKKWMTRDSQGRFSANYDLESGDTVEELIFTFDYEEGGGAKEVSKAVAVADVDLSLQNKYWWFFSNTTSYYVWYNGGTGTDPNPSVPGGGPSTKVGIEVTYTEDDVANTIASLSRAALTTALSGKFTVSGSNADIILTFDTLTTAKDAVDGNSTFTISTTTQGIDGNYRVIDRSSYVVPEETDLTTLTGKVDAIQSDVDTTNSTLENATYGLSALKTLIDSIQTDVDAIGTDVDSALVALTTIDGVVDDIIIDTVDIQSSLANATYGLNALHTDIAANNTILTNGTYGLSALKTLIDTINSNTSGLGSTLTTIEGKIDTIDSEVGNLQSDLTAVKGAGWNSGTDTLEKIRDAIDGIDVGSGGYIG